MVLLLYFNHLWVLTNPNESFIVILSWYLNRCESFVCHWWTSVYIYERNIVLFPPFIRSCHQCLNHKQTVMRVFSFLHFPFRLSHFQIPSVHFTSHSWISLSLQRCRVVSWRCFWSVLSSPVVSAGLSALAVIMKKSVSIRCNSFTDEQQDAST